MIFFWGDYIIRDVPRGPFTNNKDQVRAHLTLVPTDPKRITKTSDDEDDVEATQDTQEIAKRLLNLLLSIFPSNTSTLEQSILFHDDLSMQYMFVDANGKITGVIDWECVLAHYYRELVSSLDFFRGKREMRG